MLFFNFFLCLLFLYILQPLYSYPSMMRASIVSFFAFGLLKLLFKISNNPHIYTKVLCCNEVIRLHGTFLIVTLVVGGIWRHIKHLAIIGTNLFSLHSLSLGVDFSCNSSLSTVNGIQLATYFQDQESCIMRIYFIMHEKILARTRVCWGQNFTEWMPYHLS